MKLNNYLASLSSLVAILILLSTSCKKDNNELPIVQVPDDIVIPISDNSVYNQGNFSRSFEQLFVSYLLPMIGYSHYYDEEFRLISSSLNYPFFGDVGNGVHTYEHQYNANNVIVKTIRSSADPVVRELEYEYEYDEIGQISKLTKISNGNIRDIVELKYNEDGFLIEKKHLDIDQVQSGFVESFIISSGKIESYTNENQKTAFSYKNNLVNQMSHFEDDQLYDIVTLEYDAYSRISKVSFEDGHYETYLYNNGQMETNIYNESNLSGSTTIVQGMVTVQYIGYYYSEDGTFSYAIQSKYNEEGINDEYYYLSGEIGDLSVVGKSLLSEWHTPSKKPTKQEFFSISNEIIYFSTCDMEEHSIGENTYWEPTNIQWFTADGMDVEILDIEEEWVLILSVPYFNQENKKQKITNSTDYWTSMVRKVF
jgi:hypothetical protein